MTYRLHDDRIQRALACASQVNGSLERILTCLENPSDLASFIQQMYARGLDPANPEDLQLCYAYLKERNAQQSAALMPVNPTTIISADQVKQNLWAVYYHRLITVKEELRVMYTSGLSIPPGKYNTVEDLQIKISKKRWEIVLSNFADFILQPKPRWMFWNKEQIYVSGKLDLWYESPESLAKDRFRNYWSKAQQDTEIFQKFKIKLQALEKIPQHIKNLSKKMQQQLETMKRELQEIYQPPQLPLQSEESLSLTNPSSQNERRIDEFNPQREV